MRYVDAQLVKVGTFVIYEGFAFKVTAIRWPTPQDPHTRLEIYSNGPFDLPDGENRRVVKIDDPSLLLSPYVNSETVTPVTEEPDAPSPV